MNCLNIKYKRIFNLINVLFYIAESDGHVSVEEEKMIENIAYIFGLTQALYLSIKESRKSSDNQNT